MSNSIEITYGGTSIYNGDTSNTLTLPTSGKYMTGDIVIVEAIPPASSVLEENDWSVISKVAQAGEGGNYWSVGDTKSVALSGTVGTLALDTTLYVYIIGINHRDVNGITFQGFKTTAGMIDVCLVSSFDSTNSTGSLAYFTLNHRGSSSSPFNTNYGGWKGCDARYDLLGSTNVAPSGYGATPTTSRVGYDAQPETTTRPVSNTLMSCLPADLRAVMQPMTIYTDNKGDVGNIAAKVTTSVDYLPLLAEFEIFGARTYANSYEQNNQTQYAYYAAGNSKIKYRHSATGATAVWWGRSPYSSNASSFCAVTYYGDTHNYNSRLSVGLAPAFMV